MQPTFFVFGGSIAHLPRFVKGNFIFFPTSFPALCQSPRWCSHIFRAFWNNQLAEICLHRQGGRLSAQRAPMAPPLHLWKMLGKPPVPSMGKPYMLLILQSHPIRLQFRYLFYILERYNTCQFHPI